MTVRVAGSGGAGGVDVDGAEVVLVVVVIGAVLVVAGGVDVVVAASVVAGSLVGAGSLDGRPPDAVGAATSAIANVATAEATTTGRRRAV